MLILNFFNQPFFPFLNLFFIFLIYFVYVYMLILMYIFFRTKKRKKMIHLIITSLIGIIFIYLLKYSIARPRPYLTSPDIIKTLIKSDPSFPSAHAFISFLCLYFLPKQIPKWARYLSILYLLLLVPIGIMYIGVHYPSDIIAGAIIGFLFPKIISEDFSNRLVKRIFTGL